jgi:hypothetical protein
MRLILTSILVFILYFALSCTNEATEESSTQNSKPKIDEPLNASTPQLSNASTPKPLNPNGDSELALLMREMFDDGMRIRQQILDGEEPDVLKKFEAIHTAVPTEEGKTDSDHYRQMAKAYVAALKTLEDATVEDRYDSYQAVVQSCMNCHKAICPGPMVRIKKMYLPKQG